MMKEDVKGVGDIFKQRRKDMNLSLKEVENATSIRISYLQAIEEGQMGKLISPIYAQGFLMQYASFLGVDGDKIVREHPEIFVRPGLQDFSYGIGTLEVRGNPGTGIKWLPNAIWVALFGLVLVAAWGMARFFELI